MKKMWERCKPYLGMVLTVAVGILAFIGSYQYYIGYPEEIVYDRVWSSSLYSALQLYLLSPTVDIGEATPLCYEIAKWLAPLCTAYWILKAAESVFRHNIAVLKRRWNRKKQVMVFGFHDTSELFLRNLKAEDKNQQLILVAEGDLEREKRLNMERNGCLVYQMDLIGEEERLRKLSLEKVEELILFYEDPTLNFALLKELVEWAKQERIPRRKRKATCSIWCEDETMKKIIMDYYDAQTKGRLWNLNVFDLPDITAAELFREKPLYQNCLKWAVQRQTGQKTLISDVQGFLEQIPQPHLLLMGFGRYGRAIFRQALLTGMLSDRSKIQNYEKLRITIIDKEAEACKEMVEAEYPRLSKICQIQYIDSDIGSARIEKELFRLPKITYIVICFSDQTMSVKAMEKMKRYLTTAELQNERGDDATFRVPIAVRMKTGGARIPADAAEDTSDLFFFGDNEQILTGENVICYQMEEEAKTFHERYQRIQSKIFGSKEEGRQDREELWNQLNFESKESCRAQVLNKPYFQELIRLLGGLPKKEEVLSLEKEAFLEKLSNDPMLDILAALEHKRWCMFCYCNGYVGYHPDPKEKRKVHMIRQGDEMYYGKVHHCLIDDWEEMKTDAKANGTIIYDLCGIYGYAEERGKQL